MTLEKTNEQVAFIEKYLRKIDYIIRTEGRAILTELSITVPQFTALQILINNGNMTIGELSQKMSLACSTITDLIDRMEKAELVNRTKVLVKRREYLASKLNDFSYEDKETLNKVLSELYKAMNQENV